VQLSLELQRRKHGKSAVLVDRHDSILAEHNRIERIRKCHRSPSRKESKGQVKKKIKPVGKGSGRGGPVR